jgi:predicted amidophosphoribosyltransferase
LGLTLDKQLESSTYIGDDESGNPQFNNIRTEIGEAVFQLKYRSDFSKIEPLSEEIAAVVRNYKMTADFVIPMTPSKPRKIQPVFELAKCVADKIGAKYTQDTILKNAPTLQIKDIPTRQEKIETLNGAVSINENLGADSCSILLIDDIYSSGASIEAVCSAIKKYKLVQKIFVVVLSRTKS